MHKHEGAPKRAIIYTRISKDATGEGAGVKRQEEDCRKLADLKRWDVVAVETDSVSAYGKSERPGWERLLHRVQNREADVIVAYHLDRVTRNMQDLERLIALSEAFGVEIATVTGDINLTSDMGRMMARILAAVARQEVERKGARQKRANQQRASEGSPWVSGWRPFGYTLDMQVIPEEATLIREAARDVLAGTSLNEIARRWRASGITTPRSSKGSEGWTHQGVKTILLNPRNVGMNTYRGQVIGPGKWEAILTEEEHILLVGKLTDSSRRTNQGNGAPTTLLGGIAKCSVCGEPVFGGTGHKGVKVYQCNRYHSSVYRDDADDIVRRAFAASAATVAPGGVLPIPSPASSERLWDEEQAVRERQREVAAMFARGSVTAEQLDVITAGLNARLAEIEEAIAANTEAQREASDLQEEGIAKFLESDLVHQRKLLDRYAEITLYPKGRGRKNVPIEQQVTVYVRSSRGGEERLIPALAERPEERDKVTASLANRVLITPSDVGPALDLVKG